MERAQSVETTAGSSLVIVEGDGRETPLEPLQRLGGARTAIDEIADPEEAVARPIEAQRIQRMFESAKSAMDITDHEVSASAVQRAGQVVKHQPSHF